MDKSTINGHFVEHITEPMDSDRCVYWNVSCMVALQTSPVAMDLRWSPYLTPLNWNIPGRWFPHAAGKAGGTCWDVTCLNVPLGVSVVWNILFQLICNLWDGPMKHWGGRKVHIEAVGERGREFRNGKLGILLWPCLFTRVWAIGCIF